MKKRPIIFFMSLIIAICLIIICPIQIYNFVCNKKATSKVAVEQSDLTSENQQPHIVIEIYFKENTNKEQIEEIRDILNQNQQIFKIEGHSSEEHKEKYFGNSPELSEGFEDSVEFGPYLEIFASETIDYTSLKQELSSFDFIDTIKK